MLAGTGGVKALNSQLRDRELQGRRGKGRFFSVHGGIDMALRRNTGNLPSHTLGMVLHTDMHWSTVGRWELLTNASLIAGIMRYYAEKDSAFFKLDSSTPSSAAPSSPLLQATSQSASRDPSYTSGHARVHDEPVHWAIHQIRGGATNAWLWHKQKAHTLEISSAYGSCSTDANQAEVDCMRFHGDLQLVIDGTGKGMYAMKKTIGVARCCVMGFGV